MSAELFRQVEEANIRLQHLGWCDLEKANTLAAMVIALRPTIVCEIGVFGGRSLQPMAQAMKTLGSGVVIGIDPWSKDASLEGMADQANIDWWNHLDHESVYQRCIENIAMSGIEKFVRIIRSRSDDVDPAQWDIGLLHVDGSHEETAYRDITRFAPCVVRGGIVVCDDISWTSGAPKRGVDWLLKNYFIELYPLGTGAVFQRIK